MNTYQPYLVTVVVAVIVGAAAFYGGMQYQLKKTPSFGGRTGGNFNGRTGGMMGSAGQGGQRFGNGDGQNMRPVSGEIISMDDASMTIKLQDGSSKIVILSEKTAFNKNTEGTKTDLKTGDKVTAFGTTNADGSITAQTVGIGGGMFGRMMTATPSASPTK